MSNFFTKLCGCLRITQPCSSSSDPVVCSILDIPDEILVKIILRFNARERLALADSCKRFHGLIFGDEELLRELDFSKNGRLTTPTHIYRYFGNEERRRHVRRVNVRNVICMGPGVQMLNDTIGRATNLVDVNIHGVKFKNIREIASFLESLVHIKRLSLDWPDDSNRDDFSFSEEVLQKRFGKLEYFSTKYSNPNRVAVEFFAGLQLCTELEELRILANAALGTLSDNWLHPVTKLRNLKIVKMSGLKEALLREPVISMLSDLDKWTEFQPIYTSIQTLSNSGFYLEKDVEICEQLRNSDWFRNSQNRGDSEPGLTLDYMSLLTEIIKITHENVPETFCSSVMLSPIVEENRNKWPLIEIDDAKQLLKNPGHQPSFLYLPHCIESDCNAHLFVSAFKNLTELIIYNIKKTEASTPTKKKNFARRLRRKDSSAAEEPDDPSNLDSSFRMLVQNTPHVKELTIEWFWGCSRERCDLESLSLISNWKNLTALRLAFRPLEDGKFLIDIGKQCPKPEILVLFNLAKERVDCYTSDLSKMLIQCRNLREFAISEDEIDNVSEVVASLSNNLKLRRFYVKIRNGNMSLTPDLMSSIEGLLRNCVKLNTFGSKINWSSKHCSDQLSSALRRIKSELNRPKFQFQFGYKTYKYDPEIGKVHKDASTSLFSPKYDWIKFR